MALLSACVFATAQIAMRTIAVADVTPPISCSRSHAPAGTRCSSEEKAALATLIRRENQRGLAVLDVGECIAMRGWAVCDVLYAGDAAKGVSAVLTLATDSWKVKGTSDSGFTAKVLEQQYGVPIPVAEELTGCRSFAGC